MHGMTREELGFLDRISRLLMGGRHCVFVPEKELSQKETDEINRRIQENPNWKNNEVKND